MNQIAQRLKLFFTFWDSRFEDINRKTIASTLYRDFSAGLIVALTAIPMAMGFAIAMGLRPEQGIIAGAVACLVGRTFGGSKYQVYGPTAAFIPVIAGLMKLYGNTPDTFAAGHGFLVFCSVVAGVILMIMGLSGAGKFAKLVPNSIIVGFTVGIAITIALSNIGAVLGIPVEKKDAIVHEAVDEEGDAGDIRWTFDYVSHHISKINPYTLAIGLGTFALTKLLLRISIFIPGPIISMGAALLAAQFLFPNASIELIRDKYGEIPSNFFVFTPPRIPDISSKMLFDCAYFVFAIVFVSAVESLLCSSMADRLANNRGTKFNPDKEFWGQGLVQIITPLINGFPCTGALARTATSIKAGAMTPFAGYFKGVLKILLAIFLARWLALIPTACIGGILLWVASNMVKPAEIKEVWRQNNFHRFLMVFTAVMVPIFGFLEAVLAALVLFAVGFKFFDKPTTSVTNLPHRNVH